MAQHIKNPSDYFYEPEGVEINLPQEPKELFEARAKNMQLWCHVCEGLTTYEELHVQPAWSRHYACPHCGLFATVQDIT